MVCCWFLNALYYVSDDQKEIESMAGKTGQDIK
jgi:hypothetical protein